MGVSEKRGFEMKIICLIMVFASMFNISYYARAYTVDAAKLLKTIDDKIHMRERI